MYPNNCIRKFTILLHRYKPRFINYFALKFVTLITNISNKYQFILKEYLNKKYLTIKIISHYLKEYFSMFRNYMEI